MIKKAVSETNSQMGFAFDGDADRCVFIDNKAKAVSAEKIVKVVG